MQTLHIALGVAVLLANLAAFALGGWAWVRRTPSAAFWYLLRGAQAAVVAQVAVGGILVLAGGEPASDLHYVYGLLPLVVTLLAEGMRAGAAERELTGLDFGSLPGERQRALALAIVRRETGIMAVSSGLILFLALRAAGTTPLL